MNENEEKFWDTAITEAATGKRPPDQVERILARLNAQPETPRAKTRRRWIRYPLEAAAAAALVVAMGFATGLLKWPGEDPKPPEVVVDRKWAAGPDSVVVETETSLRLERGWVLLQPGAPDVQCGESALSQIDGLVLAHAGAAPMDEQVGAVQDWLRNNQVEADMLNAKKWVAGLAMAVLVFNGSAILDGQEVEGEPKPAPAEPVWHVVRSVMDIDNLPEGVKRVSMEDQSSLLLDFLVERKSIEDLNLRHVAGMTPGRLAILSRLPSLKYVNLVAAQWEGDPDYEPLLRLPALKQLEINPVPLTQNEEGRYGYRYDEFRFTHTLQVFKNLRAKGVAIHLPWISADLIPLGPLLDTLPDMKEVVVSSVGNLHLKALSELTNLKTLTVHSGNFTDIGIAYLARHSTVTTLHIRGRQLKESSWYQLGRIKTLTRLKVAGAADANPAGSFARLKQLPNLQELDIAELEPEGWEEPPGRVFGSRSALLSLPQVRRLKLTPNGFDKGWQILPHLKARDVEIVHEVEKVPSIDPKYQPGDGAGSHIETLVIGMQRLNRYYEVKWESLLEPVLMVIGECSNLKRIEVRQNWDHSSNVEAVISAENVEPLLEQLRKAAPKATVEFVLSTR